MCTCMQWNLSFHMSQDMLTFLTAMASQASDIICWTIAWLCTQKRSNSTQQTTSSFSSIFFSKKKLISSDKNNRCFLMIFDERRQLGFASKRAPDPPSPKPPYTSTWRIHLFCVYYNILYYILYIYIIYCIYIIYIIDCRYIYIYIYTYIFNSSDNPQRTRSKMTSGEFDTSFYKIIKLMVPTAPHLMSIQYTLEIGSDAMDSKDRDEWYNRTEIYCICHNQIQENDGHNFWCPTSGTVRRWCFPKIMSMLQRIRNMSPWQQYLVSGNQSSNMAGKPRN